MMPLKVDLIKEKKMERNKKGMDKIRHDNKTKKKCMVIKKLKMLTYMDCFYDLIAVSTFTISAQKLLES